MKPMIVFALISWLAAAPVSAGMVQVQEPEESANCELRGAGMVTPSRENSVVFPQDGNCAGTESESRELPKEDGATKVEVAGVAPATLR